VNVGTKRCPSSNKLTSTQSHLAALLVKELGLGLEALTPGCDPADRANAALGYRA
jgi:hypothetical protein